MLRCIHRLPKFALLWGGGNHFALRLFGSRIPYGQSSRLIRRQVKDADVRRAGSRNVFYAEALQSVRSSSYEV